MFQTPRAIPLSAAPPHIYERFLSGGLYLDEFGDERYISTGGSASESPIPRVSEPVIKTKHVDLKSCCCV